MNADEVQADQTGESQPIVCEECRKSQTNHYGPCPHWNDQKKINEQFAKCLPGMLQDMAEVIVDVERRPAAEVEQEYGLPPGSLEFLKEAAPEQTFGPSQAEFIRQATKHAQQTPAGGPTVENPWMKAERLEKERDEANAAYKSLQKDRDLWHIAAKRWISHASKLQNDLQLAKFEAADLKLLLAESKSIEKTKEFSRNLGFLAFCILVFIAVGVAVAVLFKR